MCHSIDETPGTIFSLGSVVVVFSLTVFFGSSLERLLVSLSCNSHSIS